MTDTPTDDVVERVARAIMQANREGVWPNDALDSKPSAYEMALARAALATLTPTDRASIRDWLIEAYTAGANDVHMHLSGKEVEREADFAEAASDYADFKLGALKEGTTDVG